MGKRGPKPIPVAERFWRHVDKTSGCWLWTASVARRRGGYGQFNDGARMRRAHRVAWELETGEVLPPDVALCHKCDTPACVRPSHLFKDTQAGNLADMRRKGRGHVFTSDNVERGTDRYNARLNPDLVRTARAVYVSGGSISALARTWGLSRGCVRNAATGETWKHVA